MSDVRVCAQDEPGRLGSGLRAVSLGLPPIPWPGLAEGCLA